MDALGEAVRCGRWDVAVPLLVWNCVRSNGALDELPATGLAASSPDSIWRITDDGIKNLIDHKASTVCLSYLVKTFKRGS
uniref:Uncharacterized protein n=1 Tax=Oryza brachyantha TaxID=4533 RepID=J3LDT5_ORYBR